MHFVRRVVVMTCLGLIPLASGAAQEAASGVTQDAASGGAQEAKPIPAAKPPSSIRYWNSSWDFEDVDVGRLVDRLKQIGIILPVEVDGKVSAKFKVGIPVTALRTSSAYRIDGTLTSRSFSVSTLSLADFRSNVSLRDGTAKLSNLKTRVIDTATGDAGAFTGEVTADFRSADETADRMTTANLASDSVPLGPVFEIWNRISSRNVVARSGTLTGKFAIQAPIDDLGDPTRWMAKGELTLDNFRASGTKPIRLQTGDFALSAGAFSAPNIHVTSPADPKIRMDVSVDARLDGEQLVDFKVRGDDVPLESLAGLVIEDSPLEGKLDLDLAGRFSIASGTADIRGRMASPALSLMGQDLGLLEHQLALTATAFSMEPIHEVDDRMIIESTSADYEIAEDRICLRQWTAKAIGGTISGNASISRSGNGNHEVDLKWRELSPSISLQPWTGLHRNLRLATSGDVRWSAPAARWQDPSAHRGTANLTIDRMAVGQTRFGAISLAALAGPEEFRVDGTGECFGGKINIATTSSQPIARTWPLLINQLCAQGAFRVDAVRLSRVMPILRPKDLRRYRGRVSGSLDLRDFDAASGSLTANASLIASDIGISGKTISRRLSADVRLSEKQLIVKKVRGQVAGGAVTASGPWSLGKGPRTIVARATSVSASDALLPISDAVAGLFDGKVSGRVTIDGSSGEFRIRGNAKSRESELVGIPAGSLQTAVEVALAFDASRWTVRFPSIRGVTYGGTIAGDLSLDARSAGRGFNMSGDFSARHVDFGQVLAGAGISSSVAHGDMSGSLTIGGKRIQSVNDLKGRFAADLEQTSGNAIPGLNQASRFFTGLSLGATSFDGGWVAGSLGNGTIRVDDFILQSKQVLVMSQGTVRIDSQRMDLEAIISTGQFGSAGSDVTSTATRLAIDAFVPGATLLEISRIASNQTVFLQLSGTASRPIIRLRPLETAQAAAQQFLLEQLLPSVIGAGVLSN